ncbi:unnamed protein product [Symbiodinium sp. CCMP2456]|nr:unnamed protein product [Symbiodinium sp. CCMP2456]
MEDAVSISDNVAGHACFAVFDGHGGEKATVLAKQFLPRQLEKHLEQGSSREEATHQAFAAMDDLMHKELEEEAKVFTAGTSSGTVACIVLLQEDELVLLNLGDCRAAVCENGKVGTTTRDHNPDKNDQEKQHLEALGVCIEGAYVDGKVQVSRVLGDIVDKNGTEDPGPGSSVPRFTFSITLAQVEVSRTTLNSMPPDSLERITMIHSQLPEKSRGSDKGGIIVRQSESLKSADLGRVSTGAIVEEIAKVGERLCYRLEEGTGPAKGWAGISGTPESARACETIIANASG